MLFRSGNSLQISSESINRLRAESCTINGENLIGAVTPNWFPTISVTVGVSNASSGISISGSSLIADGNVAISSTTTNDIKTHAAAEKYVLSTDGEGGPGFAPSADRPAVAMAVVSTSTAAAVSLDAASSISSGGSVTITAASTPSTSASTTSKTYRDGHVTTGVSLGLDDSTATLTIAGTISQGQADQSRSEEHTSETPVTL